MPKWSMFKDNDGTTNPVHVTMFMLTVAAIGWVSFLVAKNHALPDLQGVGYLLGGSGIANLCHQASDIAAKFKGKDDSGNPQT